MTGWVVPAVLIAAAGGAFALVIWGISHWNRRKP